MTPISLQVQRTFKRHQTGQAIFLLAIGFVALIGFVGVVTDVSLLFVRYAALRRAVDAAAVAAAGQLRQDRTFSNVNLAARQFLEFHGIAPDAVLVETCASMPAAWGAINLASSSLTAEERQQKELFDEVCDGQRKLVRVTAQIESPTVFLSIFGYGSVTLQASAVSETATLDVVIVLDVSESMLDETTYNTWDEELFTYGADSAARGNRWTRWVPVRLSDVYSWYGSLTSTSAAPALLNTIYPSNSTSLFRREFLTGTLKASPNNRGYIEEFLFDSFNDNSPLSLSARIAARTAVDGFGLPTHANSFLMGGYFNALDKRIMNFDPAEYYLDSANALHIVDPGSASLQARQASEALPTSVIRPRVDCRVRVRTAGRIPVETGTLTDYRTLFNAWNSNSSNSFDGFQTAYDFYGCCNDPTSGAQISENLSYNPNATSGINSRQWLINLSDDSTLWGGKDNNFSDLVCQPFKAARDATRSFLGKIDFFRGDRVAFVTFDRGAYLIDPDGIGTRTHMIDEEAYAVDVLNRLVGVRAEDNFYWTNGRSAFNDANNNDIKDANEAETNGGIDIWDDFATVAPIDANGDGIIRGDERRFNEDTYRVTPAGLNAGPFLVNGACPLETAAVWDEYSAHIAPGTQVSPLMHIMQPFLFTTRLPINTTRDIYSETRGTLSGTGGANLTQWGQWMSGNDDPPGTTGLFNNNGNTTDLIDRHRSYLTATGVSSATTNGRRLQLGYYSYEYQGSCR
ncbi:MAG: pilus assembly protein TadG-related protein, partial [Phototrophicaceae bacterium]